MFTVRINWPSDFGPNYSVYSCKKYVVSGLNDGTIVLYLADPNGLDTIDVSLGKGAKAYVMNNSGATIDTIIN